MKLEWHSTTHSISTLSADNGIVAYVHRFRTDTYGVRMYNYGVYMYNGSTWTLVGEFPTREEAQQCVELLVPIYANFTK
jgi:hypothetical protein